MRLKEEMIRSTKHFFMPGPEKESGYTTIIESHKTALNQPPSDAAINHLHKRLQAKVGPWGEWIMKKKVSSNSEGRMKSEFVERN
jgi:hypothetical protein